MILGRGSILHTLVGCCAAFFLSGCGGGGSLSTTPPPAGTPSVSLTNVVSGLDHPVGLQVADDGSGRIFIVEQTGKIRIINSGVLVATPFLDISGMVHFDGGEQGLLGLAFHPNYTQHPLFYVDYDRTLPGGQLQTVIAEYQLSADPNQANAGSERILLTINQPQANHKGGQLAFGPDGFLYIAMGDGGVSSNGQSLNTLLGKILRIGVDSPFSAGLQYQVPADNPFVAGGGLAEIWAYGFRNPWRFSFERSGTRLFLGDVGQDSYEEVDLVMKGLNYGWDTMEGAHCYNPPSGCNMTGLTLPITEYTHSSGGVVVIAGFVYHGSAIPGLAGIYVFGDFGNGKIFGLTENPPGTFTSSELMSTGRNISSFGQDGAGELYVVDYSGSVLKIVAQ
jgi:glucose/arabinose dehydrogenase